MFLGPMFAFFVVFLVLPVLGTLWWSTRVGSICGGTKFVGLNNFIRLPGLVGRDSRDREHARVRAPAPCR